MASRNTQGGKGYRKGKHTEVVATKVEWEEDQMLGRVVKALGNKRFRVYCNDNRERICKLAGSIRKSQWCEDGTIVILSLRGMSNTSAGASNKDDIGDIIEVIDSRLIGKLKKMDGVNPALFASFTEHTVEEIKKKVAAGASLEEEDDLFEREEEGEEEAEEEEEEEEDEEESGLNEMEKRKVKALAREKKAKERDQERSAKRSSKGAAGGGDVDIDDI